MKSNMTKEDTRALVAEQRQIKKNEDFQKLLDDLFGGEIVLLSDYKQSDKSVKLKHIACGNEFNKSKRYILNKESAEVLCGCSAKLKEKQTLLKNSEFDNRLRKHGLIDYIRVSDYKRSNEKIALLHIKCNKRIVDIPDNFFRKKHKCPHCYKNDRKSVRRSLPKNEFYQEKIDRLTNGEFELLSDFYNLSSYIDLKHKRCGYIISDIRADNFEKNKNKCPLCSGKDINKSNTLSEKVNDIEERLNYEYELLTKSFILTEIIKLKHKKCGTIVERSAHTIKQYKKDGTCKLKCPSCDIEMKMEDFLDELNKIYKNDYGLRGGCKYNGLYNEMSLQHKVCGNMFRVKPINILNHVEEYKKHCPVCKNDYKRNEFNKKIVDYYGNDYEIYGEYSESLKKVKVEHKICGTVIERRKNNLFLCKNICPVCRKKDKDKKQVEKIKKEMNTLYKGDIVFNDKYKGMRVKSKFYCKKCDNEFDRLPEVMISKKRECPNCKNKRLVV